MSQSPIANAPAGDPPSREGLPRRVVVVIPALNEEATVAQVVRAIPREMPGAVVTDVVVVDDGSTDRTAAVAREAGATVVLHPRNRGSGAAFATGRLKAVDLGADIVCHMDADGQFDPADIPELIAPILQGDADFVTCTRFARKDFVSRRNKKGHRAGHALGEEVGEPHGDPARELVVRGTVHRHLVRLPRLHARGGPPPPPLQQVRLRARDAHAALARESANRRFRFAAKQESRCPCGSEACASTAGRASPARCSPTGCDARGSSSRRCATCIPSPFLFRGETKPFFGAIGSFFLSAGVFLGGWVLVHWLRTGETAPYTSFLTGSALSVTLGIMLYVLALLADMVARQRAVQERVLFELRTLKDPLRSAQNGPDQGRLSGK